MISPNTVPAFAHGLCDDAAMFPPGSAPLAEAVPAHRRHMGSPYAEVVGPLVVAASALGELADLVAGNSGQPCLSVSVTVPTGPEHLAEAMATVQELPVHLQALEVAVPEGIGITELLNALDTVCVHSPAVEVFVEIPRAERSAELIAALSGTRYRAKFRTGGIRAELYPGETELAEAVGAAVNAGVAFKATAGLHHAVRNTDPETGFEQHGFLNLLLATECALRGADQAELVRILAERDDQAIAAHVRDLDTARVAATRDQFVSFGTCSINDPLTELMDLDLLPPRVAMPDGGQE